jgi:glycosyltransferase involved in cell wall biosynthesis
MSIRALYLCYFGLREPLVQTQVLPYLRELLKGGVEIHLLTFEPGWPHSWTESERRSWQTQLAAEGIQWHARAYHQRPSLPATLYDIVAGAWQVIHLIRREGISILHARSHVAAAMGALAKQVTDAKLIFDIRGMLADEYADAGAWPPQGLNYRLTKAAERHLLKVADAFVVLTNKARQILFPDSTPIIEVIPCCVDGARFSSIAAASRETTRRELGIADKRVLVYVGALDGWYLTKELAEFLGEAHSQVANSFSLILTQSSPELLAGRLRQQGVEPEQFRIQCVLPRDIPRYLAAADLALSFIKPCYSKQFSSPTKVAEYLAAGLPILCNSGVGDVDELIAREGVGILLPELNQAAYRVALQEVEKLLSDPALATRCRTVALQYFDLSRVGGPLYRRLYSRLSEGLS